MKNLILFATLALIAAGCGSGISVTEDYDREADFAALKTFAWLAVPNTAVGEAAAAKEHNSLLDKRIKTAVNKQLESQGYEMNEANPDFYLMYHTGLDEKINVTDWGYGYRSPYWGGSNISVYQYTQGTLILDVIHASDKQLIWRGQAQGTIDENASPEEREKKLGTAVSELLAEFPPKDMK